MVTLDQRVTYLVIGALIGFVLGYITRELRQIEQKVDRVDEIINQPKEEGSISLPRAKNIALFLVVLMTLYASINSQVASNRSNDTSNRIIALQANQTQSQDCNSQALFETIRALNERTTFTRAQADANIDLVQAQYKLLSTSLKNPNLSPEAGQRLFQTYVNQVGSFLTITEKTKQQQSKFPYPTVASLSKCLNAPLKETP